VHLLISKTFSEFEAFNKNSSCCINRQLFNDQLNNIANTNVANLKKFSRDFAKEVSRYFGINGDAMYNSIFGWGAQKFPLTCIKNIHCAALLYSEAMIKIVVGKMGFVKELVHVHGD
jgi:hypothetical protein